jgi:hypothetical protein
MAEFGLFRQPHYLHWETPFGPSDAPADRMFDARSPDGHTIRRLMDASYLVEPEPGLWLLLIDANVFEPRDGDWREAQKRAFTDPAAAGWTALLRVKPFLLSWIASVTARARMLGKSLLALSHYPALDPFDDSEGLEQALFGETETLRRTPAPQVAEALAAAGVRTHFGGHIHCAGTTQRDTAAGRLTNIAVPSLVACPPGFAVAHAMPDGPQVETISLASLPLDPDLIAVYRAESDEAPEMLAAPDYGGFLLAQTRRRALLRDLPRDWPAALASTMRSASALDLACLMEGAATLSADPATCAIVATRALPHGLGPDDLRAYPLTDLIADWYVLRQAGPLARDAVTVPQLRCCRFLAAAYAAARPVPDRGDAAFFARILAVLATSLRRMDSD